LEFIEIGKGEGARLLAGGHRLTGSGYDDGCFIAPTLFDQVRPEMVIAQEEIFGPVLSILEVDDFEEAVAVANGVRYGLASSIFTRDLERAMSFVERTEAGLTHVNLHTALKEPHLPFGGVKESGHGLPEAGRTGIEFFTNHKAVYVKYRS
jgi:aldehyde dehydrogenase (NAD+)